MVLKSNILRCDYGHDLHHTQQHHFPWRYGVKLHGKEIGVKFAYLNEMMVWSDWVLRPERHDVVVPINLIFLEMKFLNMIWDVMKLMNISHFVQNKKEIKLVKEVCPERQHVDIDISFLRNGIWNMIWYVMKMMDVLCFSKDYREI